MRTLSPRELRELGDRFGIEVDDDEIEPLRERVNAMLDGLDDVFDFQVPGVDEAPAERTWRRPTEDPHNGVSTVCEVPPLADGEGVLAGLSVGVKDNIAVAGVPLECASPVMHGFVAPTDATAVKRVREAGGTITAKTNLDEFAASAWGTSFKGRITNPHDPDRIAGGSSGGSAVAVATDVVDVALGTDTGGSVRIPGALCGVVGLKATWGLVPLRGVIENTYTQDHVGPLARSVEDAARVLEAIAGPDEFDPASAWAVSRDRYRLGGYVEAAQQPPDLESVTVGRLTDGFGDGVADAVEERTDAALARLEDDGASVVDVTIDGYDRVSAVKNTISFTELAAHWRDGAAPVRRGGIVDSGYQAAFDARSEAHGGQTGIHYKSKLLSGAQILDAHGAKHYTWAQAAREGLAEEVDDALDDVDVLAAPTLPDVAPRISDSPDPGFQFGRNTRLADVTRHPAITVPNGTVEGLPIGFQLVGRQFGERALLGVARRAETVLP